jgi:CheY-like chemotaxis protein
MKKKIAIIDDEQDIVTYLSSVLQDNGFEVCSATNANDGFDLVRTQRPDLVCLDILMPEETGCSLYKRIKDDKTLKGIPVLIISGLNVQQELGRLFGSNGDRREPDGYIEKPIDLAVLIDAIQRLTS